MKNLFLVCCLFLLQTAVSQSIPLSDQAEISLFTIGKGAELYDSFGHTAIRVKDPENRIDAVYNYGGFDFDTPNFYLKFAQGKLLYTLSRNPNYQRFLANYKAQNRSITEQVLQLTPAQKQQVFNYLEENYKPENRKYLYDFFYDNCATRPNEVFQQSIGGSLEMSYAHQTPSLTHRQLIHQYLDTNSWGSLGIDIALGAVIDRPATPQEYLFLPDEVMQAFAKARLGDSQSLPAQQDSATANSPTTTLPLVKKTKKIYTPERPIDTRPPFLLSPLFILGLLSVLLIIKTYRDFKRKAAISGLDTAIMIVLGILGVLLLLLWFATDHTATKWNYNLLWAFPFHLIAAVVVAKKNPPQWIYPYMKLTIILLVLLVLHWVIGTQRFAPTLIPILLALGMRYVFIIRRLKDIRDSTTS
ncbi:MAG: DUF4105 domain-containing protein [Dokdonia sp.]|nr:hypothetical protein [Cytophagaceae bacterium]